MEEWELSLDHDDKISLVLFLTFHLQKLLNFTATSAAEYTAIMIGKSERTIRSWVEKYCQNNCSIPENKQGKYQRRGLLWSNEELNKKATTFVRENASVKEHPT